MDQPQGLTPFPSPYISCQLSDQYKVGYLPDTHLPIRSRRPWLHHVFLISFLSRTQRSPKKNIYILLEYPEAVRGAAIPGISVHSSFFSFILWAVGPILSFSPLFCSLQYIVEVLYCSYSSVCPVGTTGNLIFYLIFSLLKQTL